MTISSPRPRTTALFVAAMAAAVCALVLGPASPALAHDQLVGTTPVNGAVLDSAPTELTLSFNNTLIEVGTVINVTAPDGSSAAEGEPRFAGRDALQTLKADLAEGDYLVVWRVVSSDGHPISGSFDFTVGAGGDAEAPAKAESNANHADGTDHEHADEPRPQVSDTSVTATPDTTVWASPLLWVGIAGSLALIVAVITVASRAAKRRASSAE